MQATRIILLGDEKIDGHVLEHIPLITSEQPIHPVIPLKPRPCDGDGDRPLTPSAPNEGRVTPNVEVVHQTVSLYI